MDHVGGHRGVDFAGKLDEASVLAILARLPGQIEWVDRDAMSAKPRAGVERHKPERLRAGGVDDFPHINTHGGVNDFEFVYEGDVDAAEGVFEQLGGFGDATGGDGHDGLDRFGVKVDGLLQAGRGVATDDL